MTVELLRLRTGRIAGITAAGLGLATLLLVMLACFARAAVRGLIRLNSVIPRATEAQDMSPQALQRLDFDNLSMQHLAIDPTGGGASISVVALALITMGGLFVVREYRYGSIAATAVAQPHRAKIVASKLAATAVASGLIACALAALRALVVGIALATQHVSLLLPPGAMAGLELRSIAALTLCGPLGVGLGFLIRQQTPLLVGLVILAGVESTMQSLGTLVGGDRAGEFLPLSAVARCATSGVTGTVALAVVALWTLIASLAAIYSFRHEDLSFVAS